LEARGYLDTAEIDAVFKRHPPRMPASPIASESQGSKKPDAIPENAADAAPAQQETEPGPKGDVADASRTS
jgi:hypothetical protein